MYKRIEFFKWEKEGKRKYQINVERIFESYKCAEDLLKNLEKNLVGLDIKNKKEVNKFKEKSNQILFDIDAFMYWTYYLNLNQKNNILENNNILYNKKILYIRNLNNKFCQVKGKNFKKTKEQQEKEKYDNVLKKYNNKINELIYKINLETENNKKLKLIINLECIFYEIQKEMISKKINLDYNPFYFNGHYMKKIIKEIKRYNDKFYKKAKIDKENIEKNFIPKKINIKKIFEHLINSLDILGKDYTKKIENALLENRIDYFNRPDKKQENHMIYNRVSIMGNLRVKDIFILSHELSHMIEYEFKKDMNFEKNKIDKETEVYAIVNEYLSYIYFQKNKVDEENFFEKNEIVNEFKINHILRINERINEFQIIQKMFELFEKKEENVGEKFKKIYKEKIDDFLNNVSLYNPYLNCIYIIAEFVAKHIADKIYKNEITNEIYLSCLKKNKDKEFNIKNKYINLKKYLNINIYNFDFLKKCIKEYYSSLDFK